MGGLVENGIPLSLYVSSSHLYRYPFHRVETDLVIAYVVKLRGTRVCLFDSVRPAFDLAAVVEIVLNVGATNVVPIFVSMPASRYAGWISACLFLT